MGSFCLGSGLHRITTSTPPTGSCYDSNSRTNPSFRFAAAVGRLHATATGVSAEKVSDRVGVPPSRFSFKFGFRSLFPGGRQRVKGVALDDGVLLERKERRVEGEFSRGNGGAGDSQGRDGNWVLKVLQVGSVWGSEQSKSRGGGEGQGEDATEAGEGSEMGESGGQGIDSSSVCSCGHGRNGVCGGYEYDENDGNGDYDKVVFDRETFSRLLKKVSLADIRLYAQLSYLGHLAYSIPRIRPRNLLKRHGLHYVTSSIEKREQFALVSTQKKDPLSNAETVKARDMEISPMGTMEFKDQKNMGRQISASAAFQIAASAAAYLHTRTRSILPFSSSSSVIDQVIPGGIREGDERSKMASLQATTASVTAVVAAQDELKQAVANDLNSISSSPCEWYICDDDRSATRYFVIQGSETLASWQANLLFEPILFEGLDVFVHRGIYETAKGMYQQMLPDVRVHVKSHGARAKFRFTGHSLGGSLSLLLNLMLLIRGEVPRSSLLPVITFGAPCIMCGGDGFLLQLGLPKSHVQSITMHLDIVPRAFSCTYPNHVAKLLKAMNRNFRSHPCLKNQRLLYAPMGEFLILQPDAKFSPPHQLLPPGSALYLLSCRESDTKEAEKQLQGAKNVFLNMPHPLEILSDRSAYGTGGTIQRDHDMKSYLKCLRRLIREELIWIRKAERERRRKFWWPLVVVPHVIDTGVRVGSNYADEGRFNIGVIVSTGTESLKRFSRFVASHSMHLVVLSVPARLLID